MVDRLERLTDLVLVLLGGTRPRSLREIAQEVPGYPPEGEARRQAFERDKRALRDGGIDVVAVAVDGPEQVGYVIRSEDFYLRDLELAADEQTALNLAVAGVHFGDASGRNALWRLGISSPEPARPIAELPALPALPVLHEAMRSVAAVRFSYRGVVRRVAPAQLRFRGGWWYLVGFDLDKVGPRTFRVDRIEGLPSVEPQGSGVLPDDFDPAAALPEEPWRIGEGEPVAVDVLADALVAPLVVQEVGDAALRDRRADGSVVVRLQVTNASALRSWLFELGEHVELLSPPDMRHALVSWLEGMLDPSVSSAAGEAGAPTADRRSTSAR